MAAVQAEVARYDAGDEVKYRAQMMDVIEGLFVDGAWRATEAEATSDLARMRAIFLTKAGRFKMEFVRGGADVVREAQLKEVERVASQRCWQAGKDRDDANNEVRTIERKIVDLVREEWHEGSKYFDQEMKPIRKELHLAMSKAERAEEVSRAAVAALQAAGQALRAHWRAVEDGRKASQNAAFVASVGGAR